MIHKTQTCAANFVASSVTASARRPLVSLRLIKGTSSGYLATCVMLKTRETMDQKKLNSKNLGVKKRFNMHGMYRRAGEHTRAEAFKGVVCMIHKAAKNKHYIPIYVITIQQHTNVIEDAYHCPR